VSKWPEVPLKQVKAALKGRRTVYEEIEYWVSEEGWRVRGQGHLFGLYPPDPGNDVRLIPPWVRVDGTAKCNPTTQARIVRRECQAMQKRIKEAQRAKNQGDGEEL
jgi:hypothetical protein